MSLREEMVRYRAKERISQSELARRCGLSLQTINSIENENQTPSELTLMKIKMVLEEEKENAEN